MTLKKKSRKQAQSKSKPSLKKKERHSESQKPQPQGDSSQPLTTGFATDVQEIRKEDQEQQDQPKRGPGRPPKSSYLPSQKELDEAKGKRLVERMLGRGASMPADGMAKAYGDHWKIEPEDKELLGEVTDLWVRNRLNIEILGDRIFDIAFFGTMLMIYLPRLIVHIKIMGAEKKRKQENADAMPGEQGHGKELPFSVSDSPKPKTRYRGPEEGTSGTGPNG